MTLSRGSQGDELQRHADSGDQTVEPLSIVAHCKLLLYRRKTHRN